MRLESALFNSREGISSHGQAITVLSDNISNGETTGFKAARTEFADLFANFSGSKDSSVITEGNGSRVTAVRPIFNNGDIIDTGRQLDVAIGGGGFFITGTNATVANASTTTSGLQYTRAGNFQLDSEGYLVTADGRYVYGVDPNAAAPAAGQSPTLTRINLANAGVGATATTAATLTGNLSATSENKTVPAANSLTTFRDLAAAASVVHTIEVYDSLGQKRDVTLAFFKTASNAWTVNAYTDGSNITNGTAGQPVQIGSTTMTFGADGVIAEANRATTQMTANAAWAGGAAAGAFTINFGGYTQYATQSVQSSRVQNGIGSGQITSYNVSADGKILAQMSNGQTLTLAQLQTATFTNVDGLTRVGSSSFEATANAGTAVFGSPGSGARGILRGGALERSTTDMSNAFVDLVTIQRGYQANSQMLTAANELLQQTISMIR
jgi:flagellar hook protein FlgE